jgi:hypothetical protein
LQVAGQSRGQVCEVRVVGVHGTLALDFLGYARREFGAASVRVYCRTGAAGQIAGAA